MSSILKALKKLETESQDKKDVRSLPMLRRKVTPDRSRIRFHQFVYPSVIFSLVVMIGGGAWFVFGRKASETPVELFAKSKTEPKDLAAVPENQAPQRKIAQKRKVDQKARKKQRPPWLSARGNAPSVSEPEEKPAAEPSETEIKSPALATGSAQKAPLPMTESRDKITDEPGQAPVVSPEKKFTDTRSGTSGPDAPSDRFASIPVKNEDDSGLKLQAIAWSSDPGHRIAVINNRVVREGDSVEAAFVVHIAENAVVFSRGAEKWRQEFRIK